ncbi:MULTISPECIES: hypothetical protein [unclassified Moorena]|uniref:hypothetical protein n=1 Tax=unclassified Moorena TaxID=2683338 RepID=UPI0013C948AA|nr:MULTISPECIES: hypothetical protein [unclassified Moorena]NEO20520.1 hypothetical protein [Moorena sp. SIO4A5]NEP25557.1 hypothetical protein [Moorena sp. SIO3I6]NEQ57859.1 hypothetical protein [Moorena sp. SIO4A1]
MTMTTADLQKLSPTELDQLYQRSPMGDIPDGEGKGTVLSLTSLPTGNLCSGLVKLLAWQGKVFYRDQGFLLNRVSLFSIQMIKAKVDPGESWFTQGEATILDYSKTSFVAQKIRDEIREVSPGLYLGQAYWDTTRVLCFSLEF